VETASGGCAPFPKGIRACGRINPALSLTTRSRPRRIDILAFLFSPRVLCILAIADLRFPYPETCRPDCRNSTTSSRPLPHRITRPTPRTGSIAPSTTLAVAHNAELHTVSAGICETGEHTELCGSRRTSAPALRKYARETRPLLPYRRLTFGKAPQGYQSTAPNANSQWGPPPAQAQGQAQWNQPQQGQEQWGGQQQQQQQQGGYNPGVYGAMPGAYQNVG
jgi:hypothetical protein